MAQYCFKWRIDMYTSHSEGHVWILVHAKALISARMSWYFDNPYNARTHAVSISIFFDYLPFEILRRLAQFVLILEVFWQNLCLSDCSINNLRISPWFSWSLVVAVDKSFGTLCETQKFWSVFWSILYRYNLAWVLPILIFSQILQKKTCGTVWMFTFYHVFFFRLCWAFNNNLTFWITTVSISALKHMLPSWFPYLFDKYYDLLIPCIDLSFMHFVI